MDPFSIIGISGNVIRSTQHVLAIIKRLGVILLPGMVLGFASAQQTPPPPSPSALILNAVPVFTRSLNPAVPVADLSKEHLAFGAVGSYRLDLAADHAVTVILRQQAGEIAALVQSTQTTHDTETPVRRTEAGRLARIAFTLTTSASVTDELRVRCISKTTPCEFTITSLPPALRSDAINKAVIFEETLTAADTLRRKPAAESKTASLASYDEARKLAQQLGDATGNCEALYGKGRALLELRRYTEARDALKLAAELQLSPADSPLTATSWKALGYSYAYLGDLESAIGSYDQAAKLYRVNADLLNQEILTENMARAHRALGENETALEELHAALDLARTLNDQHGIPASLEELGNIQLSLGDLQDAMDAYREALKSLADAPNQTVQAHVLNGLGNVYTLFEQPEEAQAAFDQSLALWHEIKDPMGAAYALGGMGFLASVEHTPAAAILHYQDALDSIKGLSLDRETAVIVEEMGEAYESAGDHDKAREAFHRSLDAATKLHLRAVEADCLRGLGETALSKADTGSAEGLFAKAGDAYRAAGDIQKQAILLADEARLASSQDHPEEALKKIGSALSLIESSRKSIRNLDNRSSYFSVHRDYYDFQISLLMELDKRHPAAGYAAQALEASEHARARALIDSLQEGGIKLAASETADKNTSASKEELLTQGNALDDRIEAAKEKSTQSEYDKDGVDAAKAPTPADIEQISALEQERDRLDERIRGQFPVYAAIMQAETASAASISHNLLDGDTLLLEYWLGASQSYLWAVTSSGVDGYELPPGKQLDQDTRALYDNWTARNHPLASETIVSRGMRIRNADRLANEQAAALSRIILAPAAQAIGGHSRIVISAEGGLLSLPFAALPAPKKFEAAAKPANNPLRQLLLDTHEIVYLPSASVLPQLRRNQHEAQSTRVALFADPVFSQADPRVGGARANASSQANKTDRSAAGPFSTASINIHPASSQTAPPIAPSNDESVDVARSQDAGLHQFSRLPYSRLEAESIVRLVGKEKLWESLDFEANRDRVRAADWSGYTIVHFSTHAMLDSVHPELSGIVLSQVKPDGRPQDGFLRVQDIYGLHVPAELVVLSACETGLGKEVPGEGLVGLTRAFFYAGSQRVMASLWDVNDRGTAAIMSSFYEDMLHRGMSPSAALAGSQRKMARTAEWSAPYFWAPFVLNGEWQPPSHVAELRR